jgi:hypothetical protein
MGGAGSEGARGGDRGASDPESTARMTLEGFWLLVIDASMCMVLYHIREELTILSIQLASKQILLAFGLLCGIQTMQPNIHNHSDKNHQKHPNKTT